MCVGTDMLPNKTVPSLHSQSGTGGSLTSTVTANHSAWPLMLREAFSDVDSHVSLCEKWRFHAVEGSPLARLLSAHRRLHGYTVGQRGHVTRWPWAEIWTKEQLAPLWYNFLLDLLALPWANSVFLVSKHRVPVQQMFCFLSKMGDELAERKRVWNLHAVHMPKMLCPQ